MYIPDAIAQSSLQIFTFLFDLWVQAKCTSGEYEIRKKKKQLENLDP